MEDEFIAAQDFAAVFDGHGGKAVSQYLRQNLFAHLQAALPKVVKHRVDIQAEGGAGSKDTMTKLDDFASATAIGTDAKNSGMSSSTTSSSSSSSEPTVQDYSIALRMALGKVDSEVQKINHWSYQGSTAVAAWFHHSTPDGDNDATTKDGSSNNSDINQSKGTGSAAATTTLIVANVGDSRAVYGRNGTAIALTEDHKPDDPKETKRIEAVGGEVVWCGPRDKVTGEPMLHAGIYRVNGNLALSRAIGDRSERPAVTAEPDITYTQVLNHVMDADNNIDATPTVVEAAEDDEQEPTTSKSSVPREYIVLATDGLWDVFDNQNVVDIIDLLLDKATLQQRPQIAEVLVREALRRGAYDNVTVIIVWLNTGNDNEGNDDSKSVASSSSDNEK